MSDDSKLYEIAEKVFDAFNEFLVERNNLLGIDSPMTYISDEDGQTLIYTRGEYANELINGISKLHGIDPLKHRPFDTAIKLATTADLVNELTSREGVQEFTVDSNTWVRILIDGVCVHWEYYKCKILVVD